MQLQYLSVYMDKEMLEVVPAMKAQQDHVSECCCHRTSCHTTNKTPSLINPRYSAHVANVLLIQMHVHIYLQSSVRLAAPPGSSSSLSAALLFPCGPLLYSLALIVYSLDIPLNPSHLCPRDKL